MKPFEYNYVFVIESLNAGEPQTGSQLFDDIIARRMLHRGLQGNCQLIKVSNKMDFFGALETIRQAEINQLANPIIHLEMHGDENGLQLNNGGIVTWQELQFYLLQLNGICGNNLFVSLATCKGGYIHKTIAPNLWAPFWGFVGPFEEVTGADILANYTPFYNEFLQSDNFNNAVNALHLSNPEGYSKFRFHNTEHIFQNAYKNYEALYLTPEMVDERIDQFFAQCRPRAEFNTWTDENIKVFAQTLILDEDGLLKKKLMRKFFIIDKFPSHAQYYEGLL